MVPDLCSAIAGELRKLDRHSQDVELNYYRPVLDPSAQARLQITNIEKRNRLKSLLARDLSSGMPLTQLPIRGYLHELDEIRNRAVKAGEEFNSRKEEV